MFCLERPWGQGTLGLDQGEGRVARDLVLREGSRGNIPVEGKLREKERDIETERQRERKKERERKTGGPVIRSQFPHR